MRDPERTIDTYKVGLKKQLGSYSSTYRGEITSVQLPIYKAIYRG